MRHESFRYLKVMDDCYKAILCLMASIGLNLEHFQGQMVEVIMWLNLAVLPTAIFFEIIFAVTQDI